MRFGSKVEGFIFYFMIQSNNKSGLLFTKEELKNSNLVSDLIELFDNRENAIDDACRIIVELSKNYKLEKNELLSLINVGFRKSWKRGELQKIILDKVLKEGFELYQTISSTKVQLWAREINKEYPGKNVTPATIVTILGRLNYSKTRRKRK